MATKLVRVKLIEAPDRQTLKRSLFPPIKKMKEERLAIFALKMSGKLAKQLGFNSLPLGEKLVVLNLPFDDFRWLDSGQDTYQVKGWAYPVMIREPGVSVRVKHNLKTKKGTAWVEVPR